MRVLHVIPSIAARYGGPSAAVLGMCTALIEQGIDTQLATTDADGPGRLEVPLGVITSYQDVPTIFFPRQWTEAFKYSQPLASWLNGHIADYNLVHIHAVFSHSSLAAGRASAASGVPYLVSPHGTLDPWSMAQKPIRKRFMWALGARRLLTRAALVHYTTQDERTLAERSLGLARGIVVPLGLDEATYAARVSADNFRAQHTLGRDPYVLVLSRLHPKKHLGPFIQAFVEATRDGALRNWRLVVAGDGESDYRGELVRLAEPSEGRVLFPGWLSGEDKLGALHGASVLALPSLQENFGISVIEAMACSVPVLVSPHVNLADQVKRAHAGWVIELDPASMAGSIAAILSDPDELRRRGAAGRQLVHAQFTWRAVGSRLIDAYAAVAR